MARIFVAKDHSVLLGNGRLLRGGAEVLPEHGIPFANIEGMIASGHIVERAAGEFDPDTDSGPRILPPLSGSKFAHDPDGLRGKPLDELNMLILSIDPEMKPFDTVEEAIGQLSINYAKPGDSTIT